MMNKRSIMLCVTCALFASTLSAMQEKTSALFINGPYDMWVVFPLKHTALRRLTSTKYRIFEIEVETLLEQASEEASASIKAGWTIDQKRLLETQLLESIQTLAILKAEEKEKPILEKELKETQTRWAKRTLIKSLSNQE